MNSLFNDIIVSLIIAVISFVAKHIYAVITDKPTTPKEISYKEISYKELKKIKIYFYFELALFSFCLIMVFGSYFPSLKVTFALFATLFLLSINGSFEALYDKLKESYNDKSENISNKTS